MPFKLMNQRYRMDLQNPLQPLHLHKSLNISAENSLIITAKAPHGSSYCTVPSWRRCHSNPWINITKSTSKSLSIIWTHAQILQDLLGAFTNHTERHSRGRPSLRPTNMYHNSSHPTQTHELALQHPRQKFRPHYYHCTNPWISPGPRPIHTNELPGGTSFSALRRHTNITWMRFKSMNQYLIVRPKNSAHTMYTCTTHPWIAPCVFSRLGQVGRQRKPSSGSMTTY